MNDLVPTDVAGAEEDCDKPVVLIDGMAGTDTTRGRVGITGTVGGEFFRSLCRMPRTVEGESVSLDGRLAESGMADAEAGSVMSCGTSA